MKFLGCSLVACRPSPAFGSDTQRRNAIGGVLGLIPFDPCSRCIGRILCRTRSQMSDNPAVGVATGKTRYALRRVPSPESHLNLRPQRPSGRGERAGRTCDRYTRPSEVLRDPTLCEEQKRDLLRRWALDAYRLVASAKQGMQSDAASELNEAIDALIDLDGGTAPLSKLPTVCSARPGESARAA